MIAATLPQVSNNRYPLRDTPRPKMPRRAVLNTLLSEDQLLLSKLLTEKISFVDHPSFHVTGIEQSLFSKRKKTIGFETVPVEVAAEASRSGKSRPASPRLSYEEEAHLFMRYNFARREVLQILKTNAGTQLSASDTRRLLLWAHRALASRNTIVRLNFPLVMAMAKRTRLTGVDFNDMLSEGNLALLRTVEKFDCSRGFKFSTYSCRAILKSFSRVALRASRHRKQVPMEFDPIDERSNFQEEQRVMAEQDSIEELKKILLRNLAGLTEIERKVIVERFVLDKLPYQSKPKSQTLEQVGVMIGVTKERVRQIQNKALKKLRTALELQYLAA